MRVGNDFPYLINKQLHEKERITKIAVGGSFVLALSTKGVVYGIGENYKVYLYQ